MMFRKAVKSDLCCIIDLYNYLHCDFYLSNGDVESAWSDIISDGKISYFLVEMNSSVVATCFSVLIPNLTHNCLNICYIDNLVVHEKYRCQGVGRFLINGVIEHARDHKCYKLVLLSGMERVDAHKLYKSVGFSFEEKIGFVYYV